MTVVVNGEPRTLPDGATAGDLVRDMGLGTGWVVVERNGEALLRSEVEGVALGDGDVLEVVRAVAGG